MPVLMTGRIPVSTTLRASMPAGAPPKFVGGKREGAVLPERDVAHGDRVGDRVVRRAADEIGDRRRRRHRKAAEARGLGDRAVAEVGRRVGDRIAGEIQAIDHRGRAGEPSVAGAGELDAEVDAVARHRDDHAAAGDPRAASSIALHAAIEMLRKK